jgi:hypothetical protein
MSVDQASSLEDTLARLRQRYALYFYLPEGVKGSDQQSLAIDLSQEARLRFQEAEIHYRRVYISGTGSRDRNGPVISRTQERVEASAASPPPQPESTTTHSRSAVNEDSAPRVNTVDDDSGSTPERIPRP